MNFSETLQTIIAVMFASLFCWISWQINHDPNPDNREASMRIRDEDE